MPGTHAGAARLGVADFDLVVGHVPSRGDLELPDEVLPGGQLDSCCSNFCTGVEKKIASSEKISTRNLAKKSNLEKRCVFRY